MLPSIITHFIHTCMSWFEISSCFRVIPPASSRLPSQYALYLKTYCHTEVNLKYTGADVMQMAHHTKPTEQLDTCPCLQVSGACCNLLSKHFPRQSVLPALVWLLLLPMSVSVWGYCHWSMSAEIKESSLSKHH